MRAVLIMTSLWIGLALAGPCDQREPQMVGEKTEVTRFGEHCLGFDLGEARERPYRVTALSVPYGVGQVLMPVDDTGNPVNTFDQPVTLKAGEVTPARVEYQAQEVAYLRVDFEVRVQEGALYREQSGSSQEIAVIKPGLNVTFPWGVAWAVTFGLIGVFAWPNGSASATHHEVVPLNAAPITYSVGGGGGCLAFSGAHDSITVYPNQLQPGRLYVLKVGLRCGGLFQGNVGFVGQEAGDLVGLRWQHDGVWQNSRYGAGSNENQYNYPFSLLYPYGTPVYWEAPAPGYAARAVMVDRNTIKTNTVPVRVSVSVPYRSINLAEETRGSGEDRVEIRNGIRAIPVPDHPSLGRVAILEAYALYQTVPRLTLIQLLPDSQPVEGTASFTIGDFSYPVLNVSWRSESISQGGTTYTRQVPEYALGSAAQTHEIVVRTRSVVECSPSRDSDSGNISYYDCRPYGLLIYSNGYWSWQR
jgi:hypothetical protein